MLRELLKIEIPTPESRQEIERFLVLNGNCVTMVDEHDPLYLRVFINEERKNNHVES